MQRPLGIRLVVGERFPFDSAVSMMELIDLDRHRPPTGRDAFGWSSERIRDATKRARPVGPLRGDQSVAASIVAMASANEGSAAYLRSLGSPTLWTGVDGDALACIM